MGWQLTWLGHGCWRMVIGGHAVLLDPFLNESPTAPCKAADVDAAHILVSHGHFDHVADVAEIAKRCGATVVACYEIAEWFRVQHQVERVIPMNTGGGVSLPFGRVTLTPALHSSQLPDGSYGGNPVGFVVEGEGKRVYFACDTALFGDMEWIGRPGLDLAVLPIGDQFTMGPEASIEAVRLLRPRRVAPAHYNTWPPIAQDAAAWAERVRAATDAEPIVVEPGGTFSL